VTTFRLQLKFIYLNSLTTDFVCPSSKVSEGLDTVPEIHSFNLRELLAFAIRKSH
jgi:hypothetical protein